MKNELTEREQAALVEAARYFGRRWKMELGFCWERADYPQALDSSALQTLRNSQDFGPSGLTRYRLPKVTVQRTVTVGTRDPVQVVVTDRKFADYEDGTEPHSDGVEIERSVLSDGSVAFNVLYRDTAASADGKGKALALRFACIDEKAAWAFADALESVSWVEELPVPCDPLREAVR